MLSSSRTLSAVASLIAAVLIVAALASSTAAHHSFAAVYDMNTETEITGRLTEVRWVNPHIKISVAVAGGQIWQIEAGPVNLLSRMGIEKTMLTVGETIRVRGNPGKDHGRTLWVSNILLPDKKTELLAAPGAQPYKAWAATKIIGNPKVLSEPAKSPTVAARSIFRTWEPVIATFPKPRGEAALTDAGRRAQARYGIGKKVVADCEVPGMPFAMMSPYPIEIVQQGDRLQIRGEAYDLKRLVYLNAAPASLPASSPLGVSVGRMMGDTLTIETSRINYHSYGDLGPAESNQSHVVERFTLSPDGNTLDYDITITDPVMLARPWSWGGTFYATSGTIKRWSCGADRG
jgi:hypothetical protein